MDQPEDAPRILSSVRCYTCSSVWLETATFSFTSFQLNIGRQIHSWGISSWNIGWMGKRGCIYMDIDNMGYKRCGCHQVWQVMSASGSKLWLVAILSVGTNHIQTIALNLHGLVTRLIPTVLVPNSVERVLMVSLTNPVGENYMSVLTNKINGVLNMHKTFVIHLLHNIMAINAQGCNKDGDFASVPSSGEACHLGSAHASVIFLHYKCIIICVYEVHIAYQPILAGIYLWAAYRVSAQIYYAHWMWRGQYIS